MPSRTPEENRILADAKVIHDRTCSCDPRYLMSCGNMAQAILQVRKPPANKQLAVNDDSLLTRALATAWTAGMVTAVNELNPYGVGVITRLDAMNPYRERT